MTTLASPAAGATPADASAIKPAPSMKRVAGASLAGTTLEFYDHFIYGSAAALVFPKLFFSTASPMTAMLLSLASYGVAFAPSARHCSATSATSSAASGCWSSRC